MRKLVPFLVLALVVVACGGDNGGGDGTPDPVSITVTMEDFQFEPSSVTVPANAPVSVVAINAGGSEHNWAVLTAGEAVTTATGLDSSRILVTVGADMGSSATGDFTAPAAGIYQVICTIAGHLEAGMEGELVVSSG